jgi:hypothetical protein
MAMADRDMQFERLHEAYRNAVADIIRRAPAGVHPGFHPANAEVLSVLRSLELPASLELFYEEFEPTADIPICGIERDCMLLPIAGIKWYSNAYAGLTRNGYITFATTCGGDPYCYDLVADTENRDIPIYLFSHELNYSQSSREELTGKRTFVSESLLAFLMDF